MESIFRYGQIIALFILWFTGCSSPEQPVFFYTGDISTEEFRSGDIICRLGNGFFSGYFRQYAGEEKVYSHSGILEISGDTVFVIHAEASELTGIGFVKREPLPSFLKKITTWGVYRIACTDSLGCEIVSKARYYYDNRTPFDMDFDSYKDDKVYCTQLVALAINQAYGEERIRPTQRLGKKDFYSIDDLYRRPETEIIRVAR